MKALLYLFIFLIIYKQGFTQKTESFEDNTQIKGFANIDAGYIKDSVNNKSVFSLGQFDLFITSQPTERIKFMGETVFEYDGTAFIVDVERISIDYNFKDYFNVAVGKFHLPLGYWNTQCHHGVLLQPTTIRPDALKFEDEGGILPVHDLGIQFHGDGITKYNIGYNVLVGNGIASHAIDDFNKEKSICLNLHAEPFDNLKIYASGFMDFIPENYTTAQGVMVKKDQMQIFNGSISYMNGSFPLEFIGEYYNVTNKMDSIGTKSTNAAIIYMGYRLKKLTPYIMFDNIKYQKGESYFVKNDTYTATVGLRYKFSPGAVIKLEYQMNDNELIGLNHKIKLQFAIGF